MVHIIESVEEFMKIPVYHFEVEQGLREIEGGLDNERIDRGAGTNALLGDKD